MTAHQPLRLFAFLSRQTAVPVSDAEPETDSRFARLKPLQARMLLAGLAMLLIAGLIAGYDAGRIVPRAPVGERAPATTQSLRPKPGADLAFYQSVVAEVRSGTNYYEAAYPRLKEFGFPVGSMFNWRLPTYAYFFAMLPGEWAIQGMLIALSLAGLLLAFAAEREELGLVGSAVLVVLLIGVLRWCTDGAAYYAQEPWVAALLTISISAIAIRERSKAWTALGWASLSVVAGCSALFLRELALPFCVAACGVAFWRGRRLESAVWLAALLLFGLFLAWHGAAVKGQLAASDLGSSRGALEWLHFGGLNFVLLTARMNSFVYSAPGWLLLLYLGASLLGLANSPRRHCETAGLASVMFLGAFCLIGLEMNFYWGLLYAALLPFGIVRAPRALVALVQASAIPQIRGVASSTLLPLGSRK